MLKDSDWDQGKKKRDIPNNYNTFDLMVPFMALTVALH